MGLYEDWLAGSTSRSPFAKALANTEFVFKAMEWAFPNASVAHATTASSATTANVAMTAWSADTASRASTAAIADQVDLSNFLSFSYERNLTNIRLPFNGKGKLHYYFNVFDVYESVYVNLNTPIVNTCTYSGFYMLFPDMTYDLGSITLGHSFSLLSSDSRIFRESISRMCIIVVYFGT